MICQLCGHPVLDAAVCTTCTGQLRAELATVWDRPRDHGLAADLDQAAGNMAQFGHGGAPVTGSHEPRLPYKEAAGAARRHLHDTLAAAVWDIAQHLPAPAPGPVCPRCDHRTCVRARYCTWPLATIPAMARWLWARAETVRHRPGAADTVAALIDAIRSARAAVDRPAELRLAGTCPDCRMPVYAPETAREAPCRRDGCVGWVQVFEWRHGALQALDGHTLTATDAARALTALGHPTTPSQIHDWHHRGRITPVGRDDRGRPLYRVGDLRAHRDTAAHTTRKDHVAAA